MKFSVVAQDGSARAGVLETAHGWIETPVFMPVGTQGTVKAIQHRELHDLGAQIILGNTYHLYLRPGTSLLATAGGLHRFMNWQKPILTDSGGYQVFSLNDLRSIEEEGVWFRSHLDGSEHLFTPENVVRTQRVIGSDIMMVLDECTPYPCDEAYARTSNAMTIRWAERAREEFARTSGEYGFPQAHFGIVQGSVYPEIRAESARALSALDFDGYAIGGLAVGEPAETMYDITGRVTPDLPEEKPRYLMGVGTPENLVESIDRGIDMFDCVMPTRNARNGTFFTQTGAINIRNAVHRDRFEPIEAGCTCYTCQNFDAAYLRHLFAVKEILALQLATIHNLAYYLRLMREARAAIVERRYGAWKHSALQRLRSSEISSTV